MYPSTPKFFINWVPVGRPFILFSVPCHPTVLGGQVHSRTKRWSVTRPKTTKLYFSVSDENPWGVEPPLLVGLSDNHKSRPDGQRLHTNHNQAHGSSSPSLLSDSDSDPNTPNGPSSHLFHVSMPTPVSVQHKERKILILHNLRMYSCFLLYCL